MSLLVQTTIVIDAAVTVVQSMKQYVLYHD